jgi:hypothetical protein
MHNKSPTDLGTRLKSIGTMNSYDSIVPGGEIQLYEPDPKVLYKIDDASRMLGLSRRMLVLCCKYGLVSTVVDPVEAGWNFDGRSLRVMGRIEALRTLCDGNLRVIRMIMELQAEVDRLNAESRFRRR